MALTLVRLCAGALVYRAFILRTTLITLCLRPGCDLRHAHQLPLVPLRVGSVDRLGHVFRRFSRQRQPRRISQSSVQLGASADG